MWIVSNYKDGVLIRLLLFFFRDCCWGFCSGVGEAASQPLITPTELIASAYTRPRRRFITTRHVCGDGCALPGGERGLLCIPYEEGVFVRERPAWIMTPEHSDFIWSLMTSLPSSFISLQRYSAQFCSSLIDELLQNCGPTVCGASAKWAISSPAFPEDRANSLSLLSPPPLFSFYSSCI